MKHLSTYIFESKKLSSINDHIFEELDDNIWWLLDKWFERNEQQYQEFVEIVIKCKQEGDKVNIDNLKNIIKGTQLEKHLKQFINFIDNEVNPISNKDYFYILKQIIETIMPNWCDFLEIDLYTDVITYYKLADIKDNKVKKLKFGESLKIDNEFIWVCVTDLEALNEK